MLFTMVQFHVHFPEMKFGMLKAAQFVERSTEHLPLVARGLSTVKGDWAKYKNALHLWAAFMLLYRQQHQFPLDFTALLTLSEQIVQAASGLVRNWDPWRVPRGYPFDGSILEVPKPDSDDVKLAKKYKSMRNFVAGLD